MQASKIKIGAIYAVKLSDGLARFQVSSVTTRRFGDTPHDFKSVVDGTIIEHRPEGRPGTLITLGPEQLLGPYDEHAELVARARAEEEERANGKRERHDAALKLRAALYTLTGLPESDVQKYKQAFRVDSTDTLCINAEGIEALWHALQRMSPS